MDEGYSGQDLLRSMSRVVDDLDIKDAVKSKIIVLLGEMDFRLTEGAYEHIQLKALIANMMLIFSEQRRY